MDTNVTMTLSNILMSLSALAYTCTFHWKLSLNGAWPGELYNVLI